MTNCNIVICPFKPNELYKEKGLIDPKLYNYDAAIIANTAVMDMQYLDSILCRLSRGPFQTDVLISTAMFPSTTRKWVPLSC